VERQPANYGSTIAVVGTGLDRVYPAKPPCDLANRIAENGLIISEYPLGTPPLAAQFPQTQSASLPHGVRAHWWWKPRSSRAHSSPRGMAAEQGKDVFAIPGSIHATQARGCHALIKQGAKLVETAQDVLEELRPLLTPPALPNSKLLSSESIQNQTSDVHQGGIRRQGCTR
jgi:DNA processing protein